MRIGLAGAGRIGARHARTLTELPQVTEVLIADAEPERARLLAKSCGAQAAESVGALFEAGLDAVVVAASTDVHAELVLRAIELRLPVFCEKPLAPDVRGTLQIVTASRTAEVPVQVGFQRR